MRGKIVLAVDDDEFILKLIEAVVTSSKGTFIGIKSAEECLVALETSKPHMLILDINLSSGDGMDGMDLLARIRTDHPHYKPEVMFLTAQKDIDMMDRADELGSDVFMLKPIDPYRLRERIRNQFAHRDGEEI